MSDRDWRPIIALGFVAALLFLPPLWTQWESYEARHTQERVQASQDDAGARRQQGEARCTRIASDGSFACSLDIQEPDASDPYAKHDLRAQQEMAQWALGMLITSGIGVLVTIVGLYYIVQAYRLNAAATNFARIAAEAAQESADLTRKELFELRRPNVVVNIVDHKLWGARAKVRFKLTNIGELPADITSLNVELIFFEPYNRHWTPDENEFGGENQLGFLRGGEVITFGKSTKKLVYKRPQRVSPEQREEFWTLRQDVYFWGRFSYTDPSGTKRDAGFCFKFDPAHGAAKRGAVAGVVRERFGNFDRQAAEKAQ